MTSLSPNSKSLSDEFRAHWQCSTADNNLTLHGFRRFKTTHLLNLRFLENEIAKLDHVIYQAGLSLDLAPSPKDRLGLKHIKRDEKAPDWDELIDQGVILKLRDLLRQYDEGLAAFNNIMAMETFSLLDDEKQSSLRNDLNLYEIYKTRLVRVDLGPRSHQDPFQRRLHGYLRTFRYWRLSRCQNNPEHVGAYIPGDGWSYQNSILISEIIGRFLMALIIGVFLIVPLAILSYQSRKGVQLAVISVCIVLFSSLVSTLLKASNLEMMVVSAAYGAVLSVFIFNTTQA